jgi:hypothetical protein
VVDSVCTLCESADLCVSCVECVGALDGCSGIAYARSPTNAGSSAIWLLVPIGVLAAWRRRALKAETAVA